LQRAFYFLVTVYVAFFRFNSSLAASQNTDVSFIYSLDTA